MTGSSLFRLFNKMRHTAEHAPNGHARDAYKKIYSVLRAVFKDQVRWYDCLVCGKVDGGGYMVKDAVWREAGFGRGAAHLECLQQTLNRNLTYDDFPFDNPMNADILFALKHFKQFRKPN